MFNSIVCHKRAYKFFTVLALFTGTIFSPKSIANTNTEWTTQKLGGKYTVGCLNFGGFQSGIKSSNKIYLQRKLKKKWRNISVRSITFGNESSARVILSKKYKLSTIRYKLFDEQGNLINSNNITLRKCNAIPVLPKNKIAPPKSVVVSHKQYKEHIPSIAWSKVKNATFYELDVKSGSSFVDNAYMSTKNLSIPQFYLLQSGQYQFRVRSCKFVGCSSWTESKSYIYRKNKPPQTTSRAFEIKEKSYSIDLSELTSDDDVVNWSSLQIAYEGKASISISAQTINFDYPDQDFIGIEKFKYSVEDYHGESSELATLELIMNIDVNETPIAQDMHVKLTGSSRMYSVNLIDYVQDDGLLNWHELDLSYPASMPDEIKTRISKSKFLTEPNKLEINLADISHKGNYEFTYAVPDVFGVKSNSAKVFLNIDVRKNIPPIARNRDLNITNEQIVKRLDLRDLVSDDEYVNWTSLEIIQGLSSNIVQDYRSPYIIHIDYTGETLNQTEEIIFKVKDNKGLVSNDGIVSVNVNVSYNTPLMVKDQFISIDRNSRYKIIAISDLGFDADGDGFRFESSRSPIEQRPYNQFDLSMPEPGYLRYEYIGPDFVGTKYKYFKLQSYQDSKFYEGLITFDINLKQNTPPRISEKIVNINNNSQLLSIDLKELVSDDYGIDWQSIEIKPLEYGISTILADGLLEIDYSNSDFNGTEVLEYYVADLEGFKSNKGQISFEVDIKRTLENPADLAISIIDTSQQMLDTLEFSWASVPNRTYDSFYKEGDGKWVALASSIKKSSVLLSQSKNGVYRFKVRACSTETNQCSNYSETNDFTVSNIPHRIQTIHQPEINEQGLISVNWLPTNNVQFFKVTVVNNETLQRTIVNSNHKETSFSYLTNENGSFSFAIEACNSYGCSNERLSREASVSLAPAIPNTFITKREGNLYKLGWGKPLGAEYFLLSYNTVSNKKHLIRTSSLNHAWNGSAFNVQGFGIKACNSFGCSNERSATVDSSNNDDIPAISSFTSSTSILSVLGENAELSWSSTMLKNMTLISSDGRNYSNLQANGNLFVSPEKSVTYELVGTDLNEKEVRQSLKIIHKPINKPIQSEYSAIESSVLFLSPTKIMYGDLGGSLHFEDLEGSKYWTVSDIGIISSPPVIDVDYAIVTARTNNPHRQGKVCKILISNGTVTCLELPKPVVGSAVKTLFNYWVVGLTEDVYSISPSLLNYDLHTKIASRHVVKSTPVLTGDNKLAIQTESNELIFVDAELFIHDVNTALADKVLWSKALKGVENE